MAIDELLADLTPDQWAKVRQVWAKVDALTKREDTTGSDAAAADGADPAATGGLKDNKDEKESVAASSKALQKVLATLNGPQLEDALWGQVRHDDPDTLMVRFLGWRRWDVDNALATTIASMQWRIEAKVVSELLPGGDAEWKRVAADTAAEQRERKTAEECLKQLRSGKFFIHGTDKDGRPLLVVRVRKHYSSDQDLASLMRFIIYSAETARVLLRPPQSTVSVIFDMNGFGMSNMDWNALRLLTSGLVDHYPEALHYLYILNAPWIVNGIWAVVKGWLPEELRKRIFFFKVHQLAEHVPLDRIPKSMGGNEDWEYEYKEPEAAERQPLALSAEDTAARDAIQAERNKIIAAYRAKTVDWANGRIEHEQGLAERRELLAQMQSNYWRLDPYVRAASVYDRAGVIAGDGAYHPEKW